MSYPEHGNDEAVETNKCPDKRPHNLIGLDAGGSFVTNLASWGFSRHPPA